MPWVSFSSSAFFCTYDKYFQNWGPSPELLFPPASKNITQDFNVVQNTARLFSPPQCHGYTCNCSSHHYPPRTLVWHCGNRRELNRKCVWGTATKCKCHKYTADDNSIYMYCILWLGLRSLARPQCIWKHKDQKNAEVPKKSGWDSVVGVLRYISSSCEIRKCFCTWGDVCLPHGHTFCCLYL